MAVNDETISFGYDANGTPQYVLYDGSCYFYLTNLQGDVTAIVNTTGETVVEYSYDAWGNVLETTGTLAETLGKLNPLRYRGYTYDWETGLYYLQSRYYDPALGRFINADVYAATGQGFVGNNMFVYCGNNPTMHEDESGKAWLPSFWNNPQNQIENLKNLFKKIRHQNVAVSYGEYVSISFGAFNASGTIETAFDTKGLLYCDWYRLYPAIYGLKHERVSFARKDGYLTQCWVERIVGVTRQEVVKKSDIYDILVVRKA